MSTLVTRARERFGPTVQKANARFQRSGERVPSVFKPPYGGSSYFGQPYHWEQILNYKYWAFIAIRAHVNEIAGGDPINLGEIVQSNGHRKRVRKALGGPQAHEEFRPYPYDHPLQRVFRNPNGPDVAYDLWAWHVIFKKTTGESHWWVIRNAFGVPVEFWVIPTHWMRLYTDSEGQPDFYLVQSPWGVAVQVPYKDVVSFYEHSPLNRYEGYAVSLAVGTWIDTYESMVRMKLAMFKNSAVPALHIALGEAYNDPDEEFLARYYDKLNARFQGESRSGQTIVTGADVEVKGVDGHRPADALQATIASEEQIRDMVLAAYGVPKGVVGLEPVSDVSAYAPQRQFCRFTINPELTYCSQVITEKIIKTTPGCDNGIGFWDDRVANDVELEERQLDADLRNGVRTINEVRTIRGMAVYPHGGDNPIINGAPVPWVKADEEDSKLAQAFTAASGGTGGEPNIDPDEPDVPANDPNAVNELRSTVGGANALVSLQQQYYQGQLPKQAAVATAVLLFGFSQDEAIKLFPGEPLSEGQAPAQMRLKLNSSSGAAGGYTEKCQEGPNAGKPGPCPGPQQAESGSSEQKPASAAKPSAAKPSAVKSTPSSEAISAETGSPPPPGKAYKPSVTEVGEDGVTKAARVGIPGRLVPPPPEIGRLPNLTPHERKVETEFVDAFNTDPDGMAERFVKLIEKSTKEGEPFTFGTDDAKVLHKAWSSESLTLEQRAANRATLNCALHQVANAIAKRAFVQYLDTLKAGDEIMVTVGGCGAGKGYALKNVPQALDMKKSSKVVWDSAGDQNATENPWIQEEAEKRGLVVNYVYVHADPKKQWADPDRGVVKRAGDPSDGRMVDADVFADSYAIGAKNHQAFYDRHKDNPSAKFVFLENSGKPKLLDGIPPESMKWNRDELASFARAVVDKIDAPPHVKRGATIGARIWKP